MARLFNFRRKKADASASITPTPREQVITAGGLMTRPDSTVIVTPPHRFGLDLSQYKTAIRAAENMDYSARSRLYDMYEDAMLDTHLISITEKRKNAVKRLPIEFWRDGIPDDTINANIKSPWFHQFVEDIIDAQFWGFTLVQLTTGKSGYIDYFKVPRKNVDPQLRLIKRYQSDLKGISFDEYPGLLEIHGSTPLGKLAACLPWVIRKNGTVGDWCQFSELFGMPIRDYSYDASDEGARARTLFDAMTQGSGSVFIHQDGTKLNFVEAGNKTGSSEVYDRLVAVCNAELSKAILGNTLTTEASDTGTQALGTVHKKEEEGFTEADKTFVLDVLNYEMTDIFSMLGMDTRGGEFLFVKDKIPVSEKAQLFRVARNELGLPIDDDYIYQELGIEKPKDYDTIKAEEKRLRDESLQRLSTVSQQQQAQSSSELTEQTSSGDEGKEAPQNRAHFFDQAPDYRALNW